MEKDMKPTKRQIQIVEHFINKIIIQEKNKIDLYTGKSNLKPLEDEFFNQLAKRSPKQQRLFKTWIKFNKNKWLDQLNFTNNKYKRTETPIEKIGKILLSVLDDKYKAGYMDRFNSDGGKDW